MNQHGHTDKSPEILASLETLCQTAELGQQTVFCGDKREPVNNNGEVYIHFFGGLAKIPHNRAVMKTIAGRAETGNFGLEGTFEDEITATMPAMLDAGIKGGIHSSDACEHSDQFRADTNDGDIDCKYLQLCPQISALAETHGTEVLAALTAKQPELFADPENLDFARQQVLPAYSFLAGHGFYTSGRKAAVTAVRNGAAAQVLDNESGQTSRPFTLLWNQDPSSTLNTALANAASLPAYVHDAAHEMEAHERLGDIDTYDKTQLEIVAAVGTMLTAFALGIEQSNIAVRQPQRAAVAA